LIYSEQGLCGLDEGYVFEPDRGMLDPGMKTTVQLSLEGWFSNVIPNYKQFAIQKYLFMYLKLSFNNL